MFYVIYIQGNSLVWNFASLQTFLHSYFPRLSDVVWGGRVNCARTVWCTPDVWMEPARNHGSVIVTKAGEDSFVTKVTIITWLSHCVILKTTWSDYVTFFKKSQWALKFRTLEICCNTICIILRFLGRSVLLSFLYRFLCLFTRQSEHLL